MNNQDGNNNAQEIKPEIGMQPSGDDPSKLVIEIELNDVINERSQNFSSKEECMESQSDTSADNSLQYQCQDWIKHIPFSEFVSEIERRVIGQPDLRLILANTYNYIRNVSLNTPVNSNMLLAAPSGCGKTETYRALREYFHRHISLLPVCQIDVADITEEGITGSGVEIITDPLFESEQGGYGIIFLDEFDKKLIPSYAEGSNLNAAVQNQLLTLIEGKEIQAYYENMPLGEYIDTSKTMFIGLGSFNESREKKNRDSKRLGFAENVGEKINLFESITREDMIKLGGSYELIGRFPYVINYHALSYDAVEKIIIKMSKNISRDLGIDIVLSDDMKNFLHCEANGVYGCRLLDSYIRSVAMKKYMELLITNKSPRRYRINITAKDKAELKYKYSQKKKSATRKQKKI